MDGIYPLNSESSSSITFSKRIKATAWKQMLTRLSPSQMKNSRQGALWRQGSANCFLPNWSQVISWYINMTTNCVQKDIELTNIVHCLSIPYRQFLTTLPPFLSLPTFSTKQPHSTLQALAGPSPSPPYPHFPSLSLSSNFLTARPFPISPPFLLFHDTLTVLDWLACNFPFTFPWMLSGGLWWVPPMLGSHPLTLEAKSGDLEDTCVAGESSSGLAAVKESLSRLQAEMNKLKAAQHTWMNSARSNAKLGDFALGTATRNARAIDALLPGKKLSGLPLLIKQLSHSWICQRIECKSRCETD